MAQSAATCTMKCIQLLSRQLTNIIACIIGAMVFVCVYGPSVIDPTNVGWCFASDLHMDVTQSYVAWKAYRVCDWFFPWGMQNNLAYPLETSNLYTFCAPLLSFVFKIFSPILPADFQFIGMFGLLSFMLQALFACWIVKLYSDDRIVQVLVSILFLFVPLLFHRWMNHSFLGAQWVLLLSIFVLMNYRSYIASKKVYATWFFLGAISAGLHMYLTLMCGLILVGYCIADILTYKVPKRAVGSLAAFLVAALLILWLGGFGASAASPELGSDKLGDYSANLNALFNPCNWSAIFPNRPMGFGQYEGFAYLGAGFMALLAIALILLICSGRVKEIIRGNRSLLIAIALCSIASVLFALSPTLTFDDQVLLTVPFPGIVTKAWDVFRATGRVIWVAVYLWAICATVIVVKLTTRRTATVLIALCLCLQFYDIHRALQVTHDQMAQPTDFANPYSSNEILSEMIDTGNPEHIVYVGEYDWKDARILDDWALSNDLTLNKFYFARSYGSIIEDQVNEALASPDDSEAFIFNETSIERSLDRGLHCYRLGDWVLGLTYELPDADELTIEEVMSAYSEIEPRSQGVDA